MGALARRFDHSDPAMVVRGGICGASTYSCSKHREKSSLFQKEPLQRANFISSNRRVVVALVADDSQTFKLSSARARNRYCSRIGSARKLRPR